MGSITVPDYGSEVINVTNGRALIETGVETAMPTRNPQSILVSPWTEYTYMLQVEESNDDGNLTLNRYKPNGAGNLVSPDASMTLNFFGHGVAFGIWYNKSTSIQHFYTEAVADGSGRGTALTTFPFEASGTGNTLNHSGSTVLHPGLGSSTNPEYSLVIDSLDQYMVIRYRVAAATSSLSHKYQAFLMSDITKDPPDFSSPLMGSGLDEIGSDSNDGNSLAHFQGFTILDHYLYTLFQVDSSASEVPSTVSYGYIRSYDLNFTQNNSDGYIALGEIGSVTPYPNPPTKKGEYEGITFSAGDYADDYALLWIIRYETQDGDNTHTFNLHGMYPNS